MTTDVAARGLDIPEVDLVIQCEPPKVIDFMSLYQPLEDYDNLTHTHEVSLQAARDFVVVFAACSMKNSIKFSCIQDVDSYIHRSGRTGRAGWTGVSILFYKSQQEHMIPLVEKKAGVQFQRIGAPQPVDIIKAGARDSVRLVMNVAAFHYTTP